MNASDAPSLDRLLEAHFAGQSVTVPTELRQDFDQALAADAALRNVLEETTLARHPVSSRRGPPNLSDDYEIEREIGRGGMGVVYLAQQRSLNRQVAVKVLRPGEQTFGPLVDRFMHEAHHLAQLHHPHIVAIHEFGNAEGEPYFTMQYIHGESLADLLVAGPLTPSRAIDIVKPVAEAVQYAHRQGIIHRDLKPANVFVDCQGHVFVGDFGLARNITRDSTLTQSGELLGTPQYMAPEQARGQASLVGEATDIHALGLILYELITGHAPFAADSPADVLVSLLNQEPPAPRRTNRSIPRDLETIVLKCLRKVPADRYANVGALLEDIRRYESGQPLQARRPSLARVFTRWCARRWNVAAVLLLLVGIVFAAGPLVFDRSFADLVAWGDEELAAGEADNAARIYGRAFRKGSDIERASLADRIARVSRQLDDSALVVSIAVPALQFAPEISFGKHDYSIAQALLLRERNASVGGEIDLWHSLPDARLEQLRQRLDLAFASGIPDDQRLEAEATLSAIKLALSADKPYVRYLPDHLYQLPTGTDVQLAAIMNDQMLPQWNRGRAGIALGNQQMQRRDTAAARESYQRAYELIRQVYPMYGGVKAPSGRPLDGKSVPDAEECQLVRRLAVELRRLDPQLLDDPRGGLEFLTTGYRLPSGIAIDLVIELSDPAIEDPDAGLTHQLPRQVPLRSDGPTSVSVLDGTYRLRRSSYSARWTPDTESIARRLEIDTTAWPETVEIRGSTVQLPPVEIRLAESIVLQRPTDGATVNLDDVELSWHPVQGATRYQVQLSYTTLSVNDNADGQLTPLSTTVYFTTLRSDSPAIRLSELSGRQRQEIQKEWTTGRMANWRVEAFDAAGRRIGTTMKESRFLIAAPLSEIELPRDEQAERLR